MIRVEVDDLHEGHAEQQRLVAALPQQQASCNRREKKVCLRWSIWRFVVRGISYLASSTYT
jgi:hypothetical protein